MSDQVNVSNLKCLTNTILFATYANKDISKWEILLGASILHKKFGPGRVTQVEQKKENILLYINFENLSSSESTKRFLHNSFLQDFFSLPSLPIRDEEEQALRKNLEDQIREREQQEKAAEEAARAREEHRKKLEAERIRQKEERKRQQERERVARQQFANLREKYGIDNVKDSSPASPLFVILLKLEEENILTLNDLEWLEKNRIFHVLANYYEREFARGKDLWNIVKAGSFWRKANQPHKAIEISEGLASSNPKLNAALLTNRGAAFRDLSSLAQSESCAIQATRSDPSSYYPHNLLGAIYYQRGLPEEGDQHFQKALSLGASERAQDDTIRFSLRQADISERKVVARYLLNKDPDKYRWAEYYLGN